MHLDLAHSWKDSGSSVAYAFLLKHGSKLTEVWMSEMHETVRWNATLLTLCPNLEKLVVADSVLTVSFWPHVD